MATTYAINATNKSSQSGSICLFQTGSGAPDALSLAWFSKPASPNAQVKFSWTLDYAFVWGETGMLVPGVIFSAAQMSRADLSTINQVTLTERGFTNQTSGPTAGSLFILADGTVPANTLASGIAMSNASVFVSQARPNGQSIFTPRPAYWLTFGNYQAGQVLDVNRISSKTQVVFPPGVFSVNATYNSNGTWTVG